MHREFEIASRFEKAASCDGLLYAPLGVDLTYRKSRRYRFDFEGDEAALADFVNRTLVDPISESVSTEDTLWADQRFLLEYGMKKGALDLEKEAILTYYRHLADPGFQINSFTIRQRLYVFGEASEDVAPRFVRDIVNPAVHTHSVVAA